MKRRRYRMSAAVDLRLPVTGGIDLAVRAVTGGIDLAVRAVTR